MESKLIIFRGNSGSGKSTIAEQLQQHFGDGTLLVSQDTVRRDMLKVRDRDGNLSIDLIRQIAEYGKNRCAYVIVEGILMKKLYGNMLKNLIDFYDGKARVFYFDLSFDETVKRHRSRPKAANFGEEMLRSWWLPNDFLHLDQESLLTADLGEEKVFETILSRIHN
ncbi:kinase [Planococcus sp. YIM B11945]|uniref:kinase n=1 Tax=Planococcus sp. YIM B11945 TaxID=3435410 RepID=UPI003D7E0421